MNLSENPHRNCLSEYGPSTGCDRDLFKSKHGNLDGNYRHCFFFHIYRTALAMVSNTVCDVTSTLVSTIPHKCAVIVKLWFDLDQGFDGKTSVRELPECIDFHLQ